MSLPFFALYPRDFEADTSHLSLEEDGAYNRLLRLCWMTPGCSLPDDDAWIMRRMRVDQETYDRVVRVVMDEFFVRKSGRVSNARLSRENLASEEAHKKRVSAGKMGGSAKSLKSNNSRTSNATAMPKQPEPEPEPDIRDGGGSARDPEPPKSEPNRTPDPPADPTDRERILVAMGHDPSGMTTSSFSGTATDMIEARRWRDDLGLTLDEIIAVIRDTVAPMTGPPIRFRYFNGPMERFAAAKAKPALQPAAGGNANARSPAATRAAEHRAAIAAGYAIADGLDQGTIALDTASRDPFARIPR